MSDGLKTAIVINNITVGKLSDGCQGEKVVTVVSPFFCIFELYIKKFLFFYSLI